MCFFSRSFDVARSVCFSGYAWVAIFPYPDLYITTLITFTALTPSVNGVNGFHLGQLGHLWQSVLTGGNRDMGISVVTVVQFLLRTRQTYRLHLDAGRHS